MEEITKKQNIFIQGFSWQFFEVPRNILKVWKNFLLFNLNYFSIPLLIRTFFSPWRKYKIYHGKGFDIGEYSTALFSNLIFRLLGVILRTLLIFIGLSVEIFIIFIGIFILIGQVILPVLLVFGIYYGFRIFL